MMSMDQHLPRTAAVEVTERSAFASTWSCLAAWVTACGEAYVASALYEDLSRLSDVQLRHRGLSRENLAREVYQARARRN